MPPATGIRRIINLLHYRTLVASKAARSVLVAGGRTLVEFGFRRAHGAAAGLERLPAERRRLEPAGEYPVRVDEALVRLAQQVDAS